MLRRILLIAGFTFREAIRRKVIIGTLLLTLAFLILYAIGTAYAYHQLDTPRIIRGSPQTASPDTRYLIGVNLTLLGIYVTNMIGALLTILTSIGSISGEIDAGTLHAILPKPIRRWEFLLGRWLGYAVMIAVYVAILTAAIPAIVWTFGHYIPPNLIPGIAVIILTSLLLLSLAMLATTFLSTVTAGIAVFMLYSIAASGGFMELIGSTLQNDALVTMGIVSSLLVPSDILYRFAFNLLTPADATLRSAAQVFGSSNDPSGATIVYALIYTVVILGIATTIFQRRDIA